MAILNVKDVIASSIVVSANNKAVREIKSEGTDVSEFDKPVIKSGTYFDKYLNTYMALIDYKLNHDTRSSVMDSKFIDPTEYKIKGKYNTLINCSSIMYSKSSTVYQKPIFQYQLGKVDEFMTPSFFNTYQDHFSQIGDPDLFKDSQAFNPEIVTLSDLKCVVGDDDELLVNNADGKVDPEVSVALNIKLPIPNFGLYTTKGVEIDREDVISWLSR